jgi:hypothetical protein
MKKSLTLGKTMSFDACTMRCEDVLRDLLLVVGLCGPSPGGLTTRLAEVGTHARAWAILLGHDSFVKTTKKTRCSGFASGLQKEE